MHNLLARNVGRNRMEAFSMLASDKISEIFGESMYDAKEKNE